MFQIDQLPVYGDITHLCRVAREHRDHLIGDPLLVGDDIEIKISSDKGPYIDATAKFLASEHGRKAATAIAKEHALLKNLSDHIVVRSTEIADMRRCWTVSILARVSTVSGQIFGREFADPTTIIQSLFFSLNADEDHRIVRYPVAITAYDRANWLPRYKLDTSKVEICERTAIEVAQGFADTIRSDVGDYRPVFDGILWSLDSGDVVSQWAKMSPPEGRSGAPTRRSAQPLDVDITSPGLLTCQSSDWIFGMERLAGPADKHVSDEGGRHWSSSPSTTRH
jgi:hypothetical protein